MNKRCKHIEKDGFHRCGSYAFNLEKDDIDQGDLCDVHYWKNKAKRTWVWLTIEQVHECWEKLPPYFNEKDFAKIVEAKCKELNTCPSENSDADTINIFYIEKGNNGH